MRRRLIAAVVLTAALSFGLLGSTPARACGYEDPVCDVVVYVLDRACVKFHFCP